MNREQCLNRIRLSRRVVIKTGTSLLTDGGQRLGVDAGMIRKLRDEVLFLRGLGKECLLVTSGAVGMGRTALQKLGPYVAQSNPAVVRRQALAAVGHHRLMSVYSELFAEVGIPAAQVLITARELRDRRSYLNIGNTLEELTALGAIAIVNENDTVSTDELRYGDNDVLSAACASLFQAELLVILTSVDGFQMHGNRVPFLSRIGPEELAEARGPDGPGTGGMTTKLRAGMMTMLGGETLAILPGKHEAPVRALFEGEDLGTLIRSPQERKLSARKRWLLYARSAGTLVVDDGARRALVERGSSLLSAGIVSQQGRFLAGDVVELADRAGRTLGRGITNYSYRELQPNLGLNGEEIRSRGVPLRTPEVVHRNNLILEEQAL